MATNTWKGGTGDFNAATLWSTGTVPGMAGIAFVDAGSAASSITLDRANPVAGLTLDDAAGSLTLSGTLTVSGTLSGGILIPDGSLSFGSSLMARSRVRPWRHHTAPSLSPHQRAARGTGIPQS